MTVLSVAYPLLPVHAGAGGGAEQILYLLDRELVKRHHQSVVIAAKGSTVNGELIETCGCPGEITDEARRATQLEHAITLGKALDRFRVELVHFHGLDFHEYLPDRRVPKLATLHLPVDWYPASIFANAAIHLNCVSATQASSAPQRARLPAVMNGVLVDNYQPQQGAKEFLLWMGRICPEKGVHTALEVARGLDLPLIMAGPVHPFRDHQIYFAERIQPLLDEKRRYIGPVDLSQKAALLAQAKSVLIPSLVAETSSLVAMEALASGTPVVAFRSGALPEIVSHGETGFIVDSVDQMVEAVKRIDEISPAVCRAIAKTRFDSRRMAEDYLSLYKAIVA